MGKLELLVRIRDGGSAPGTADADDRSKLMWFLR
jgi:hypothetical protein